MITGSAGYYSRDLTEKMMTGEDCERRLMYSSPHGAAQIVL